MLRFSNLFLFKLLIGRRKPATVKTIKINEKIKSIIQDTDKEITLDNIGIFGDEINKQIEILNKYKNQKFQNIELNSENIFIWGDIHCDYNSLKTSFLKIINNNEINLGNAYIIFLGDYIDRGTLPLQTLLFLLKIKNLFKDKCILLKGNHEILETNGSGMYISEVTPAETVDFLYEYLKSETVNKICTFLTNLPYCLIIKIKSEKLFFVHGGIPPNRYLDTFNLESLISGTEKTEETILKTLLWGDPVNFPFKYNDIDTRFQFGEKQFTDFMKKNGLSVLIRSHEPIENGYKYMYDNKLLTIFSTGGEDNEDSGYNGTVKNPVFFEISENCKFITHIIFDNKS